jgi:hypothetical protein
MSLYVPPVSDLQQLNKYNKLGDKETSAVVNPSSYKPSGNVEVEKKKEDPTNENTTTKKVLDWGIYNIKAQHVQTEHIGTNIDKKA